MKNVIIVVIILIIVGNVLRWIFTPIIKNFLKEFTNPYLVSHRRKLMMHIPCIIIRSRSQFSKKKMREFYYMEADLELFQHFVLKYFEDNKIKKKLPSLTDIVNKSMIAYNWKSIIPEIYIQFGFRYNGCYYPLIYNQFRNRVYFARLVEEYSEKDFPEIKEKDGNVMIPLSYFADVIHEDPKRVSR